MNLRSYAVFAALSGAAAVVMGAFGAHALKPLLGESIATWQTAVFYQLTHSIYLFTLVLTVASVKSTQLRVAIRLCVLGILCFSGSLYLLVGLPLVGIEITPILGPVTPLGGLFLIGSWLAMGWAAFRTKF